MPPKRKSRYERASDINDDELWSKMRKQDDMLYKALCSIYDKVGRVESRMAQIQSDNNRHKLAQHTAQVLFAQTGGLAHQTEMLAKQIGPGKSTREDEDDEETASDSEVPSPKRKDHPTQDVTKQRVSHHKKGHKSPHKATVKTSVLPPSRGRHDAVESHQFPFDDDFHE